MKQAIALLSLLLAACLDHELPPDQGGAPSSFIALQRDFAAFESWPSYALGSTPLAGHPPGERVAYLNRTPAPGAESFPVGTMIVKTAESGGFEEWLVHAMVKRGDGYNLRGAKGWEWFELKLNRDRVPVLVWRGEVPPNGESYGCISGSCEDAPDCNACHADAIGNDYVKSPMLELGNF